VNHEIAIESKRKDWRKTYSRMVRFFGWVLLSLMGCFPLSAMTLGFFSSEAGRKDVRWWRCMWVDLQSTKGAILLAERMYWKWWLVGVHYGNTKRQGFLSECEGFFIEQCSWFPEWGFSADSTPRDRSLCVFG
jgi:hypothetical protein